MVNLKKMFMVQEYSNNTITTLELQGLLLVKKNISYNPIPTY